MASKQDLVNKYYNNALKDYRFTLQEASEGTLVLYHAPDGWMDAETTYSRHETYHSVLRNVSTNELTFYKEGRDFIKNVYENTGIDANITFTVERLDRTTMTYDSYPSANKIDLSTYTVNEISVSVQLIDTQFKEKVINRDDSEIDLLKRVSIEGLPLSPFAVDRFIFPDTSLNLDDTAELSDLFNTSGQYAIVCLTVTNTDFTELQTTSSDTPYKKASSFFKESTRARRLRLTGTMTYDIWDGTSVNFALVRIDNSESIVEERGLHSDTFGGSGIESGSFSIDEYIDLDIDDSLLIQVTFVANRLIPDVNPLTVTEIYTGNQRTTVTGMRYYEALLRAYQITSDKEDCFYSEFFGCTDTPDVYLSDGEIGFITKGIYMRRSGGAVSNTIPVKSKELFESLSSIYRLGLGVETIAGEDKIRIEDLDYFFDDTVVVDISSKLRSQDIEKQVIPEMFYKSIECGYNKYQYESSKGLLEFNTKSTWVSIIKSVFTTLRKIARYRTDTQGIRLILNAPYSVDDNGVSDYDPDDDVKGDDDIFLVDCVRDSGNFLARTNEGFDYIGGSVYAQSSYNVYYSPARMIRRWGGEIKAGIKALNTYLRWQSSDKNTTLESRLTTESNTIVENDDILVNDLTDNRWLNEKYIVESPLTTAQLNAIDANPNGLVKLSDTQYGWILDLKTKNKDGMAEFELLRVNLNIVTPS